MRIESSTPFDDCGSLCAGTTFVGRGGLASMEQEIWKSILGYENQYEVSSIGRVRSVAHRICYKNKWCYSGNMTRKIVPKIFTLRIGNHGYPTVALPKSSLGTSSLVHVLVASAFIGPKPIGLQVNHIDGDKTNNKSSNLQYCSPSENIKHAYDIGLRRPAIHKKNDGKAKINLHIARQIKKVVSDGRSMAEAAYFFGVTVSTISLIVKKRAWVNS